MSNGALKITETSQIPDPQKFQARFASKIDSSGGPESCWNWTGRTNEWGYGTVDISHGSGSGGTYLAHRVAHMLATGNMPAPGLVLRHTCVGNRRCCNPAHLLAGTQAENIADRERQGRGADRREEKHPQAKLDPRAVLEVRAAAAFGGRHRDIGSRYGISTSAVGLIASGKRWTGLPLFGGPGWLDAEPVPDLVQLPPFQRAG